MLEGAICAEILVLRLLQSLPSGIEGAIEQTLRHVTPLRAVLYGGSGVLSIAVVRWLVKRSAAGTTVSEASSSTAGDVSVSTTAQSTSKKHNVAFTLPSVLPLSKGIRSVTHNEIHAIELGLVVGGVTAWLFARGRIDPAVGILVAFVGGSLGFNRYSSKAFKTIRLEAWYALLALAGGGALGWAIFIREPGLLQLLGV